MGTLVIHFEDNDMDVWSGRKLDIDMWKTSCFNWGIEELRIVDLRTDKSWQPQEPMLNLKWYGSLNQALEGLENLVYIDIHGNESLWEFTHSEDMVYVIGASYGFLETPVGTRVVIPQIGNDEMHSTHIAAMVLAHRYGNLFN